MSTDTPGTTAERDPIEEAAARYLDASGLVDAGACETEGSCDDCAFGCHDDEASACDNDGGTATAEERMVIALAGVASVLISAVVVATGGGALLLTLAGLTVLGGLVLAALGVTAVKRGGELGDRLLARGVVLLPWVMALLLIGVVARVVTFVVGLF